MSDTYSVLYIGRLAPEVDPEQAVAAFAARFGVDPRAVRAMIEDGREVTLQDGLSADQARQLRRVFERMGLLVRTDPHLGDDSAPDEPQGPAKAVAGHHPFQPPKVDPRGAGQGGDFHEPAGVPAAHAWRWIKDGFSMVVACPAAWIGAVLIWTVLNMVMSLIPLVNFLAALVTAVFMGGIMLGAHEQHSGGRFTIGHLFAGFSTRFGPLFLVGVLYMVGMIALVVIMVLLAGGLFAATVGLPVSGTDPPAGLPAAPVILLPALVSVALTIPLLMAYWFAPALVALDDVAVLAAMGMSFRACLRNILPFLLYGLLTLVLLILGAIPLLLGLLIVIPVIVASVYAGYRDIFRG